MRQKLATFALLLAWLCANGALLDVVQVVAWGKMFAGYSHTMPVQAALRETFDATKPCEMCVGVAHAKEDLAQKTNPVTTERAGEKLVLALERPAIFVLTSSRDEWPVALASAAPTRRERVPVPPPRA